MPDAAPAAAPSAAPVSTPAPPAQAPSPAPAGAPAPATAAPLIEGAKPDAAPVQPVPPPPKMYKRTINGKPVEIPADQVDALAKAYGMDPQDLLRGPDLMKAAYAKFEEAAKARKEWERQQAEAKKRFEDPRVAEIKAKSPGISDDDAWAVARVQALYEQEQMSPEQKMLAEERKKREELEKKLRDGDEAQKEAQAKVDTQAAVEKFQREIPEAAAKYGLPRSPAWGRAMIEHMAAMARQGRPIDAEEAALYVKEQVRGTDRTRFTEMEPGGIVDWLGQDVVRKILQFEVARVKGGGAPATPNGAPAQKPTPKPSGATLLSPEEWRKRFA